MSKILADPGSGFFDDARLVLGKLCKRGHNWQKSGCSLRVKSRTRISDCIYCKRGFRQGDSLVVLDCVKNRWKFSGATEPLNEKYCLGSLCSIGHDWNSTGKSRRYLSDHSCVECVTKGTGERSKRIDLSDRFYLATLCKNNHDYKATGQSLRHSTDGDCADCRKERYSRNYQSSEYRKKAYHRATKWRKTEKGRLVEMIKLSRRRSQKKARQYALYTQQELKKRLACFEGLCAYCDRAATGVDHFISLNRGGSDVLSNLLPCCPSCNSSKNDRDPYEWFQRQANYSLHRWRGILKVLGKTQSNYEQIPFL